VRSIELCRAYMRRKGAQLDCYYGRVSLFTAWGLHLGLSVVLTFNISVIFVAVNDEQQSEDLV
jgi:hypothetical protein